MDGTETWQDPVNRVHFAGVAAISPRAAALLEDAVKDIRWELLQQLRDAEQLLGESPDAIVLGARSGRGFASDSPTYGSDWGFRFKAGRVELSFDYERVARFADRFGVHHHHTWSGWESREDVFGRTWSRRIAGPLIQDDFGNLVEVPQ
jgi:hypothetical protein